MSFTITNQELAVLFRISTDPEGTIPAAQATALKFLAAGAKSAILTYAPDAPDEIHDLALSRLAGFLYDNDADTRITNPMQVSGAAALLSQYRVHNVGVIGGEDLAPTGGLPAVPSEGTFLLVARDGIRSWFDWPLPPGATLQSFSGGTPEDGDYALAAQDGSPGWLKLPVPS